MEKSLKSIITRISKEVEKIQHTPSLTRRYTKELKDSILELFDSGIERSAISKATGLSMTTLANWQKSDISRTSIEGCFKEIAVIPQPGHEPQCPGYIIETPSGYKIHLQAGNEIPSILKAIESY